MSIFYLSCAIIFTALAQTSYKLYFHKNQLVYLAVTIILFCVVPVMTYLALKSLPLSVVYMSTGLTYVLIMFFAKYILGEFVEKRHVYAVTLIISGVLVYNI